MYKVPSMEKCFYNFPALSIILRFLFLHHLQPCWDCTKTYFSFLNVFRNRSDGRQHGHLIWRYNNNNNINTAFLNKTALNCQITPLPLEKHYPKTWVIMMQSFQVGAHSLHPLGSLTPLAFHKMTSFVVAPCTQVQPEHWKILVRKQTT